MAEASRAKATFHLLGSAALVVAALYWGQKILIPFVLAVLLTLVLAPLVSRLERRGLRRIPAVLLVVCLAFLLLGAAGWAIASQVGSLIDDLPRYKENVRERIGQLKGAGKQGLLGRVQDFLEEVEKASQPAQAAGPVLRVQPQRPSLFVQLQAVVGAFLGAFSATVVVFLLVLCMLSGREDLRNRVIRLAGSGRLTLTTRALDEAGRRLGGYLLGSSLLNAGFGVAVGLGLFALQVPYAALWGLLAGLLRFVPAVGPWLVAPFPAALAWLGTGGLGQPLLVVSLFGVLELLTTYLLEPRVCGSSIGIAPVPLLLAILFWTGLWGLVGLVLATPLTVCLAVLGKHVAALEFLAVLLGSRPALRASARYYQRLLARDRHEALAIVADYLGSHSAERLCDEVLVPALVLIRRGRRNGELRPDDEQFMLRTTREVVADLPRPPAAGRALGAGVQVLAVPACDEADEVALLMFQAVARVAGHDVVLAGGEALSAGLVALVQKKRPALVFVATVAPGGLTQARYLCRRLRSGFPTLPVAVGCWGQRRDPQKARKLLLSAGADQVLATLRDAAGQLAQLSHARASVQNVT
jgi:predicted PurR-regulated permease PerM